MTTSGVHGLNPILKYLPTFSANWRMSRITNFLGGFLSNGKIYNSTLDLLIRSPRFLSSWPNLVKICLIINFLMEDLSTWTELLVKDHFLKVILIHHYHRHNHRHIIMITLTGTSESGFLKFEKWKVKKKSFHSFSRSAKWKKNAFTLFREVQSEKQMLSLFFKKWKVKSKCFETEIEKWKFSRILCNSLEMRFFSRLIFWKPKKTACWNR